MAGKKFWAHGTTVTFESTEIKGLTSIGLPDETTEEVDVTDTNSGGDEELIPGLRRSGSLTLEARKIVGDAGQDALRTARTNGTTGTVVITFPESATDDSTVATLSFEAFVTAIGGEAPLVDSDPATVTYSLKVTGTITEAAS